jgi:hypothetical protein
MIIHTASEGITLSKKLETESAEFYEKLAELYKEGADVFLSFARENEKNLVQIDRAYYGVITDAIEGGYAFNIDPDDYSLSTALKDGVEYADVLNQTIEIEKTIVRFYTDAAEQSKPLLADVPRAFTLIAKKRGKRLEKLGSLL